MRQFRTYIGLFLSICFVISSAIAQHNEPSGTQSQPRMLRVDPDKVVMVGEIGAVIIWSDDKLVVAMVPPKDRQIAGLQQVDLQKDDEVKMMNGKNLKSIKELKAVYTSAQIEQECKIGVYREGRPHLVTFVRKAEKDLPAGMQMRVRKDSGNVNNRIFPALGIEIEKKGSDIVVVETMPHAPKGFAKGDIIKSLNGKSLANLEAFDKEFDATKVGDPLKFEIAREGKISIVMIPRPKPMQRMMINK